MTQRTAADMPLPGGDFRLFLTQLSLQGFLACGLLENPLTGTKTVNQPSAHKTLDDLKMLQDKTQGNLDLSEAEIMHKVIEDMTQAVKNMDAQIAAEEG